MSKNNKTKKRPDSEQKNIISSTVTNIIIIAFTILGFIGMRAIYGTYTSVIDKTIQNEIYLKDINICIQEVDINLYTAIDKALDKEDFDEYVKIASSNIKKSSDIMSYYHENEKSSYETKRYRLFSAGMTNYTNSVNNIINSLENGNPETAKSIYNQEFMPIKGCVNELIEALIDLSSRYEEFSYNKAKRDTNLLGIFFAVFGIALLVIFNIINARQMKTNEKLASAVSTNIKAKESLNTAVFNDILTDVGNRISFINKFAKYKIKDEKNTDYYFAMFDIDNFSSINITYGIIAGDTLLVSTASRLKTCFRNGEIYRTGSDEFVVVLKCDTGDSSEDIMTMVNNAYIKLSQPHDISSGNLSVSYSVSVVKKNGSKDVDISMLQYLKDAITKDRMTVMNKIVFFDVDAAASQYQ